MAQPSVPTPYRKVLVPFDGSGGATKALRRALLLSRETDGEVTAFAVDEHVPRYAPGVGEVSEEEELRSGYFAGLRSQVEALAGEYDAQVRFDTAVGHAAQSIVKRAEEEGVDLIVIGQRGSSGAWERLLGSTTSRVVDHAHCDVLVVR